MGLLPELLHYIDGAVEQQFGTLRGRRFLELGNQKINHPGIPEPTGKAYYENRGAAHTSFDLNGRDGALPVDLSQHDV